MVRFADLQQQFGFEVRGTFAQDVNIERICSLKDATQNDLSFLINDKYLSDAQRSKAFAIIVHNKWAHEFPESQNLILTAQPHALYARIASILSKRGHPLQGVSPLAYIDPLAKLQTGVTIMPFAFIGPRAEIGAGTVVYPHCYVGAQAVVGKDCLMLPHSVLMDQCIMGDRCILNPGAVIGGDGFGFAADGQENIKIPQDGRAILEDDVEIGSLTAIDRGSAQDTQIKKQTKIDNLVQIAHNVCVGEACFIAAQVGISGSTQVGNRVTLAGQVGVAGHVAIADHTVVLGQAGVTKSVMQPGVYNGTPARPNREYLRQQATLGKISSQGPSEKKPTPKEKRLK